jgi:hypothetical protein
MREAHDGWEWRLPLTATLADLQPATATPPTPAMITNPTRLAPKPSKPVHKNAQNTSESSSATRSVEDPIPDLCAHQNSLDDPDVRPRDWQLDLEPA